QHDVPRWPAWGGALARGPTGRAPCGPLLWPAQRLPWWTSVAGAARAGEKAHARAWRDWRGLACSVVAARPHPPAGRCAPLLVEPSFTVGCVPPHWVATSSAPPAGCCGVFLPPGRRER